QRIPARQAWRRAEAPRRGAAYLRKRRGGARPPARAGKQDGRLMRQARVTGSKKRTKAPGPNSPSQAAEPPQKSQSAERPLKSPAAEHPLNKKKPGPAVAPLSKASVDGLAAIAERSVRLGHLYSERLTADDGYQVIDPKTVTATFQEFAPKV